MAKKTFYLMLVVLVLTFGFISAIKYLRPGPGAQVDITPFPMAKDGWAAQPFELSRSVMAMLHPDAIFNALYTGPQGDQIDLFFSYFTGENTEGGVHSPRNCMPGSGWQIVKSEDRPVRVGNRTIPAARLWVKYGSSTRIVDFWYVTQYGETASDYRLKLYQMFSALTFRPTDVAFVRFIADDTPTGLAALDEFQQSFAPEIYRYLPFGRHA